MNILTGLVKEIWFILNEMSPYLLFGFSIAGVLYVLIPREKIYTHLAGNNLLSIVKAALIGVPLPLCSCGVIPVAAHLRKEGAGKSATLTFLISTPTTGVDSILATYALLGPVIAVIRPIAAFFGGFLAGIMNNFFDKEEEKKTGSNFVCSVCEIDQPHTHSMGEKLKAMLRYGFIDLVADVRKWLIIGIISGGIISFLIPASIIEAYLGNPLIAYTFMLLIGIPMYVCATGSIPIAASLIMKGMVPGAGLVFLVAGPATNTATISFIAGKLGKRTLIIYLIAIIITALLFGFLLDHLWLNSSIIKQMIHQHDSVPMKYLKLCSSILLITLFLFPFFRKRKVKITGEGMILKVKDMTCEHCVKTITAAVKAVKGVENININLKTREVEVTGRGDRDQIIIAIQRAGYTVENE